MVSIDAREAWSMCRHCSGWRKRNNRTRSRREYQHTYHSILPQSTFPNRLGWHCEKVRALADQPHKTLTFRLNQPVEGLLLFVLNPLSQSIRPQRSGYRGHHFCVTTFNPCDPRQIRSVPINHVVSMLGLGCRKHTSDPRLRPIRSSSDG